METLERKFDTHEEWLLARREFLGGTDVAAIVGENQWKSPLSVWHDKKGVGENHDNPKMRMGREREPFIRERYIEKTGHAVRECGTFYHPSVPFFAASPDGLLLEHDGILECKTGINKFRGAHSWGEPGTDQVPRSYLIQGVWYLGIANREFVDFAFEDRETCETNVYRLFRDLEYEGLLFDRAESWWRKYVIGDVEPPADERDLEELKAKFPQASEEKVLRATPNIEEMVYEAVALKAQASPLYKKASDIEAAIKQVMGDASAILLSDITKKVTWTNNKDSEVTDWDAVIEECRQKWGQIEFDPILLSHTTTKPGPRVFRMPKL